MATIVTRAGKGSALTWTEGDANITNLNDAIEDIVSGSQAVAIATSASTASTVTLTADETTNATNYLLFANATTGNLSPRTDTALTYNPSTNTLTAVTFTGNLIGNANSASAASQITLTADNSTNATNYLVFANATTGNAGPKTDTGLTYNPSTNTLTATTFSGNATSSSVASTVTLTADNSTNAVNYLLFANATTGNLSPRTDTGITYNPSTNTLTAGQFVGEGNFTTLNASSTVGGAGITSRFASPGPIGSTTASTGAFTTLSASSTVSGTGFSTYLASPPAIGGTAAAAGRFTALTTTNTTATIVSESNGNIVIAPNGTGMTMVNNIEYDEKVHALGTTSGTIAPNAANGNVQTITLNGNLTINAFTSPVQGQSVTLIINTGGTGRTLTSTMKFAGGEKTLSTTSTTDILSIFYDGTNYWASLSKDFK
jgi:hypothetical protein